MAGTNGYHPEGPQEPQDHDQAAQASMDQVRAFIRQEVRQELVSAMGELHEKGLLQPRESAPTAQNSPEASSRGNLVDALKALLLDPQVLSTGTTLLQTAFQLRAMTTNPLLQLQSLAQQYPQLMSLYAPNPWGPGFQGMMSNSYLLGAKSMLTALGPMLKSDAAKKGLGAISDELFPGGPGGPSGTSTGPTPGPEPPPESVALGLQQLSEVEFQSLLEAAAQEYRRRQQGASA